MPRTIVEVPEDQLREVGRICNALKISRAEAVRRGLNEFIRQHQSVQEDGFGLWKGDGGSATDLTDAIRGQW